MRKLVTFTMPTSVKTMLCCSAAILLSACGGMADEPDNQSLAASMAMEEASNEGGSGASARFDTGSSVPEPAPDTAAAQAPAVASPDQNTDAVPPAATPQGGSVPATNAFQLNGYQGAAPAAPSEPGSQAAPALAPANGQQVNQPPAA